MILLALGLTAAAYLRPCCTVSINGTETEGSYSPLCVRRAMAVYSLAAEEICRESFVPPETELRHSLTIGSRGNDVPALTDALLRHTEGVAAVQSVYVDGIRLGCVAEDCDIGRLLRENVSRQKPNAALYGGYSGSIEKRTVYAPAGTETDSGDMVLLVSGMAPVMYYDANGQRA